MASPAGDPVSACDLLTLEELSRFRRRSALRGAGLVLHAWGIIAAAVAVHLLWPSPLTLVLAAVVIGARQLGLAVLMHECAHWLLFPGGRLNTWVGTWLCAAPLGADLREYRRRHHQHHRLTGQAEDPDLALAPASAVSRGRLALALLGDLVGWSALCRIGGVRPGRAGLRRAWRRARAPLLANVALCAALTLIGGWSLYLVAWVLPWATWYQLVTRVRNIAEHGLVPEADDPLRNARTIGAGPLERALVAPYWVNYHLEHHLLVFVPCWKLPGVHAHLLAKGLGGRMERAVSYAAMIGRAAGSAPSPRAILGR